MVTVTHSYDSMGRRISSTKNAQTTIFAYDGWNVVEEYNSTTPATPTKIHTWGIDLSGSAQGAGGVGGLLFTEDLVTNTAWHHHYDGNGNVTHLTNAAAQGVGIYTYDAFGNTVTATGTAATANKYRFSTKSIDEEITSTPLYYYGYRFYTPITGRWINRDPIEEKGGLNLYGFVGNDGIVKIDLLGKATTIVGPIGPPLFPGDTNRISINSTTFVANLVDIIIYGRKCSACCQNPDEKPELPKAEDIGLKMLKDFFPEQDKRVQDIIQWTKDNKLEGICIYAAAVFVNFQVTDGDSIIIPEIKPGMNINDNMRINLLVDPEILTCPVNKRGEEDRLRFGVEFHYSFDSFTDLAPWNWFRRHHK